MCFLFWQGGERPNLLCSHRTTLALASGICLINGLLDKSSHNARQVKPVRMFIPPKTCMVLLQGSEIMVMPTLPIKMPKQLMRAEAEPVSSSCCSSIRFAPGVRTQLAISVAGSNTRANIMGLMLPRRAIISPLAEIVAKQDMMIDRRRKRLASRRYNTGPVIIPRALKAK